MGCPDAVRAALLQVNGLLEVNYDVAQDIFSVRYESVLVSLENIFAVVFAAGKQLGQEYFPELIT